MPRIRSSWIRAARLQHLSTFFTSELDVPATYLHQTCEVLRSGRASCGRPAGCTGVCVCACVCVFSAVWSVSLAKKGHFCWSQLVMYLRLWLELGWGLGLYATLRVQVKSWGTCMNVLTKIEVEGLHRCVFSLDLEQSQHVAAIMVGKCVMMPVNINNLHENKPIKTQHAAERHIQSRGFHRFRIMGCKMTQLMNNVSLVWSVDGSGWKWWRMRPMFWKHSNATGCKWAAPQFMFRMNKHTWYASVALHNSWHEKCK